MRKRFAADMSGFYNFNGANFLDIIIKEVSIELCDRNLNFFIYNAESSKALNGVLDTAAGLYDG